MTTQDNYEHFLSIYNDSSAKHYSILDSAMNFTDVNWLLTQREATQGHFSSEDLKLIEDNFYNLMRFRCRHSEKCLDWLRDNQDKLPKITNDLLNQDKPEWFAVGGMYGGFSYGLFEESGRPYLITDSWSRIVGGSGEQHKITPDKVELLAGGFV